MKAPSYVCNEPGFLLNVDFAPLLRSMRLCLLIVLIAFLPGCNDDDDNPKAWTPSQPPNTAQPTVNVVNKTVIGTNANGQPIVNFLFKQTKTTNSSGVSNSALDLQIQNISNCTLTFSYKIVVALNAVRYEVQGSVANLLPNTTADANNPISTNPVSIEFASIVITPIGSIVQVGCSSTPPSGSHSLLGSWDGWGASTRNNAQGYAGETGLTNVSVSASGLTTIEFICVDYQTGIPNGYSITMTGSLDQANQFTGNGTRRFSNSVISSFTAAGSFTPSTVMPGGTRRIALDIVLSLPNVSNYTRITAPLDFRP